MEGKEAQALKGCAYVGGVLFLAAKFPLYCRDSMVNCAPIGRAISPLLIFTNF